MLLTSVHFSHMSCEKLVNIWYSFLYLLSASTLLVGCAVLFDAYEIRWQAIRSVSKNMNKVNWQHHIVNYPVTDCSLCLALFL